VRVNNRPMVRIAQIDYNPSFFGETTQHNVCFSTGLVSAFGGTGSAAANEPVTQDAQIARVPQDPNAKMCEWKRYGLGKDTVMTQVKSSDPTIVQMRIDKVAGSVGFQYHCKKSRGPALITYKYTDVNNSTHEEKLRVVCNT
jgi:hypothetical protein